jgi:hypothetical protein
MDLRGAQQLLSPLLGTGLAGLLFAVAVVNTATPPTFTITATAVNDQAVDGNLTLDQAGTKTGNW